MNLQEKIEAYKTGDISIMELQESLCEFERRSARKPLSEGQKGLWILQKMSPELSAYNVPICFSINQELDIELFKQACHFVMEQYPILNSIIGEEDGVPYQMIKQSEQLAFAQEDVVAFASNELLPYLREKVKEPFFLEDGSLLRVQILSRSETEHIVLITIHHIIFDGSSIVPLLTTLLTAYCDLVQGNKPVLIPLSASYSDFVEWEEEMLAGVEGEKYRSYWESQLTGTLPVLELPADHPRFGSQSVEGQVYSKLLSPELSEQVQSFAKSLHVNLSAIFQGILNVLLHHYTGLDDIIVGVPTRGRSQEQFDSLIGYFINMIPMRSKIVGSQSFLNFVQELQLTIADGLDHAAYPFPTMVRELNVPRTAMNSPIFQVAFFYQNFLQLTNLNGFEKRYQDMLSIKILDGIHQEGEYEFVLEVFKQEHDFALNMKYSPDLFEPITIKRMMGHYVNLLEQIISNPSLALDDYSLLSAVEQDMILVDWNGTKVDYPKDQCIHELFEQQVRKTPNAIAVMYEEESLTYRELDEKSTTLAIYLQKQGVKPNLLVGIYVERSIEMIVGLLGILKAGGAYVPLDPDYPFDRLEYMIIDSKMSIILTQARTMDKITQLLSNKLKAIVLDTQWDQIECATQAETELERDVTADHLAYVIYTSGSTGKPKGVMIPHQALTNFLITMSIRPGLSSKDILFAVTTYCFDIAGLELYLPLITGAQCFICSAETARDVEKLKQQIQEIKPTVMQATPVTWTMLFQSDWKNEEKVKILCGGEALPERLKQHFIETSSDAWNMFGPTETTIWSTVQHIKDNELITIGKPIGNTQIYIIDDHFKPSPIGVPGELCIAGDGLARGYFNRPELTAEKFIENPFIPGTKLYRTGDLARWLASGNIEFLGRSDHQVKIRGFRIELGEIETKLTTHPEIKDSVVVVREQDGIKQLIAYYVRKNQSHSVDEKTSGGLNPRELREYLKGSLPSYMIPALYLELDSIPLTPNGKIDRKKLMNCEVKVAIAKKLDSPQSEIEEEVLEIWKNVLNINAVSIEDGFFDVGGDSLLAIIVADRIKKNLECDFNVTKLFQYTNIKDISKYITDSKNTVSNVIEESYIELNSENSSNIEKVNIKDAQNTTYPGYYNDSLAIIGISCEFPGAKNQFEFWSNLVEGKESIQFFSKEELRTFGIAEELIQNSHYVPAEATIEGKEFFDPGFFKISPKDAERMDPQMRLLLLHSWKAIEDAGYTPEQVTETSVFMSASNSYYQAINSSFIAGSTNIMENIDEYISWIYAQSGTIPTMISHRLGLKGPSFFVHSNCSSSLAGLHLAYQSLQSGEARYGLIGASTIFPSSTKGYVHQPGSNFSSDGHCKTFDASADGMIAGEGVAVIVVKKVIDAIEDGDHIYAILRGIGVNNDGGDKVGFYAPSVKGQVEVIQKVLDSTKVNPESISYIETHGTGTKLGDPIEFAALDEIYQKYTTKKQFCGLGSVKTNIGHLDTVAGLAGCIKVALSLYNHEIPPLINYKKLNPNIEVNNSPFYIVDKLQKLEKKSTPYRVALTSIGIGGTNAHAIFEEYTRAEIPKPVQSDAHNEKIVYIVPLSAKNNNRLKAYAQQLHDFLNSKREDSDLLASLAYTLQIGREAMEHRVVFTISNIDQLVQKLRQYIAGNEKIEECYSGEVRQAKESIELFGKDEDVKEIINKWIKKRKIKKVAELWARGFELDWGLFYTSSRPCRISLPTYPFAQDYYGAPKSKKSAEKTVVTTYIHPLLQQNTSDFSIQKFTSIFTGQEFFLADHVIKGQRVLPGVAYLEMARAAVEIAADGAVTGTNGIRLKNVVWARPIIVEDNPVQIHIELYLEDNGEITYEIYRQPDGDDDAEPIVHCQGSAMLSTVTNVPALDIACLQAQCRKNILSKTECYKLFKTMGFEYGLRQQGIETVYIGENEVLAKLSLPSTISDTQDQFSLHPSLMDAALQSSMGLTMIFGDENDKVSLKPSLPFALQEIEIISPCTTTMWAFIRYSNNSKAGDKIQKLDIDVCDEQGTVCVRLKGFSARVLEGEVGSMSSATSLGSLLLEPDWKEELVAANAVEPAYDQHLVMLCEPGEYYRESIEPHMKGVLCFILESGHSNIAKRFQTYAVRAFEEIQSIIKDKPQGKILIQIVTHGKGEQQTFSGLSGLLKTAQLENPKIIGQMIEVEKPEDFAGIVEILKENSRSPINNYVHYQDGKRLVAGWKEIEAFKKEEVSFPWKDGGNYLISGGAGKLGLIFAKEIAHKALDATLILTGRSPLNNEKQSRLEEIEALGARVAYRQVDVTDEKEVDHLMQSIEVDFGSLNGIIHSAGVIRDNFIFKKSSEELLAVLAPKVDGLVNLDQASKRLSLDFFIFFSSISGSLGSIGQADYATANVFMDEYAKYRNTLVAIGQRQGLTLSINWPLWEEGGMHVDEETKKMMRQNMGISVMQTSSGIQALYHSVANGKEHVLVLEGNLVRMKQKLLPIKATVAAQIEKNVVSSFVARAIDTGSLVEKVQAALAQIVSKLLKISIGDIDGDTELNEYGFDSISFIQFANKLNDDYKLELTPTIFFEEPTICSLAEFLVKEYQAVFAAQFAVHTKVETPVQIIQENDEEEKTFNSRRRSRFVKTVALPVVASVTSVPEPIAIVGMSGIFPMSKDVNEFWKNLMEDRDCITEIPKDRWDWQEYYGDPTIEANKTNIKWGGFIDGVDEFEPLFFGISPKEAELMDPQQRLLMTYVWKTIEDAGYSAQSLSGTRTAIFVGTGSTGYSNLVSQASIPIEGYTSTGSVPSVGPNRMSYFLNIYGPSEPIETACSSSLVAIHRAVNSIENGNCEMAIVGGVHTLITPDNYISFNKAGMLCEDGRCKTFSDKANGYVRGEGAGMLLLKKLSTAEQDGDHIYGVIRGSAENHGGRANSLTAPNPKAQAEVLKSAYTKAGIDPRTVTYIEAHGTGTELGDPIEINGLKTAFKELYQATGDAQVVSSHCGLGSVKTNIGHLELASGIASVIKVLLQMKNKTLIKNLHCARINPYIQLSDSPFYIVQETKEWKVLQDGRGNDLPRRAGVSSFGFGGVNAHVVLEEYVPKNQRQSTLVASAQQPAVIVLSAKNEQRLTEQAKQLLTAVHEQQFLDGNLVDIAYTLQVGREAMEERLAIVVISMKELEEKLQSFVEGQDGIEDLYRGQVKRNKETLAVFAADEDMKKTIDAWISKRKYGKLLDLWVKGLDLDWTKLYDSSKPHRMSLPTYPFAKEHYWVPRKDRKSVANSVASNLAVAIHPLLQQNISKISGLQFSSTFTGQEFFLKDHVVTGQKVLPGVAYLEMAREAVQQVTGEFIEGQMTIRLKNVVWARPIVIGLEPVQVHIGLFPEVNGEIAYEIYTEEDVLHSQGSAVLSTEKNALVLDIKALQTECTQGHLSPNKCYEAFRAMGLDYGPGFQGIKEVYVGEGQVLGKLALPSSASGTQDQFILHPSLMDSALQSSIGLMMLVKDMKGAAIVKLALPFALQELEILGRCTPSMWAVIRDTNGSKEGDKVQKLDVDLCDEQGNVCVRMKGFSSRVLEVEGGLIGASPAAKTVMLEPGWQEEIVKDRITPAYEQHIVLLCEPVSISKESIESNILGVRCLILKTEDKEIDKRFDSYAVQVFAEIKAIVQSKPQGAVLVQIVIPSLGEQKLFAGLAGLLKTAQLENSKLMGQLIEVGEDSSRIVEILTENSQSPVHQQIRYQDGKRLVAYWKEVPVLKKANLPWKDHGVYLITGGAGGLGQIFANEIVHKVKDATLILTGRSPLSEMKKNKLKKLEDLGARIEYQEVDVTKQQAVSDLLQSIQDKFGSLNGIIHGAGILRDNFISNKTSEELQAVLAPKVTGLVNLDLASRELPLDFFILFSSISGSLGNPGQADYSIANAFMDAYAQYRNVLVDASERQGRTLSINWPLWKDGGMHIDAETEKMIVKTTGMTAMRTSTGIEALYQGLASRRDQIMVLEGNLARMKQKLYLVKDAVSTQPLEKAPCVSATISEIDSNSLMDKVQAALAQAVSKSLKIRIADIDDDTELNEYGFDSITFTEFSNKLNCEYKLELTPTIFYEYPTLRSLAEYLTKEYQAVFGARFAVTTNAQTPIQTMQDNDEEEKPLKKTHLSWFVRTATLPIATSADMASEPIAIIGMSGIFPGGKDVNEFWENLVKGKDCITEIPKERWDWREYYGDPTKEANKTNIKWGGFIDGVDEFDPLFFGISPTEAELMDPQQRLLMTYVWKAIEDAGYSGQSISGTKTAIFVGTGATGYSSLISQANIPIEGYTSTGAVPSVGPNRMSYFLNINGPSEPIETACSSSLVAIHRAVNAIEHGNCEMAIVGGVHTLITPDNFISFNKAGMLSADGRCKTFSDEANGYVRGEGAGMLLLKKLSAAEQDGDHIYGVICGSAENHGGRANSLTAPNPKAQAEVLKAAYIKAGIDPRTVTYIEAHGTGTELGDPIEINGLKTAFKELYQATGDAQVESNHCGLGSVKTYIGHLELAAGIAGVIKVLLQMKNKKLIKNLHCARINPYIQLKDSPFYILQDTKEWKALQDGRGNDLPRRAGVSSFGFGGVNAHVVLEEYVPKNKEKSPIVASSQTPAMIVLSARNKERLTEQARQLLTAVEAQQLSDSNLVDIAYTLQVGREAMEERLAVLVSSMMELEEKLQKFVDGQDGIEDLYRGQVKRNKETLAVFAVDEDMERTIDAWISKRKYGKLLDLWVKGLSFDWQKLYAGVKPHRISLPTYPFTRERYWIAGIGRKDDRATRAASGVTFLHPLLHHNTSDLSKQQFSSTFTGQEFFLADHVVTGQKVLPGVAYLEMAREAIKLAVGERTEGQATIRLKNVVWARPIVVGEKPVQVHIGLFPEDNGEIVYEIYNDQDVIHSQGKALLSSLKNPQSLDIKAVQEGCTQGSLTSGECYETFKAMGIDYGPGYQGIKEVYVGKDQVLAKLALPPSVAESQEQFILHPSLMDSALQSSIGLMMFANGLKGETSIKPALPFELEEIEILGRCTSNMWALIQYTKGSKAGEKVQKLDIDLCDEQGYVCVHMKGFSSRVLEGGVGMSQKSPAAQALMLQPSWQEQAIQEVITPAYTQHVVLLCEMDKISRESIESSMLGVRCLTLKAEQEEIDRRFQSYALQIFAQIKTIIQSKPQGNVLVQIVISSLGEQAIFSGLIGLLKTAQLEHPKLMGQLIEVDEDCSQIVEILTENSHSPVNQQIRYQGGKRLVAYWEESPVLEQVILPWKDHGIYLITGGVGGLGQIFAREIAHKVKEATLILTGRSALSVAKLAQIKELEALGTRVEYQKIDVTKQQAVSDLLEKIIDKFGSINGIIHSAGVLQDNFILKKTPEEFQAVMAPKVAGLVNLDLASRELPLDFFVTFSSIAGCLGNLGQADYSTANAFMDAYARYRNILVGSNERQGQTLSINWPLWKEGGMHVNEKNQEMMIKQTGMIAMQTATGIKGLYQGLASGNNQVMMMEGDEVQLRKFMNLDSIKLRNSDNFMINDEITQFDELIHRKILEKIVKAELTKAQFKYLIKI